MDKTTKRQLVELHLGRDLAALVRQLQDQGCGWRRIAEDITSRLDGTGLVISHETLRTWFSQDEDRQSA